MATLVLQVAGQAVGGALFGGFGGVLGGAVGALAGNVIDRSLLAPDIDRTVGAPLSDLSVQSSTEGRPIPKVYGPRPAFAGQVIWATDYEEVVEVEQSGGGKGGGGTTTTTTYSYYANFAVALCEGADHPHRAGSGPTASRSTSRSTISASTRAGRALPPIR